MIRPAVGRIRAEMWRTTEVIKRALPVVVAARLENGVDQVDQAAKTCLTSWIQNFSPAPCADWIQSLPSPTPPG